MLCRASPFIILALLLAACAGQPAATPTRAPTETAPPAATIETPATAIFGAGGPVFTATSEIIATLAPDFPGFIGPAFTDRTVNRLRYGELWAFCQESTGDEGLTPNVRELRQALAEKLPEGGSINLCVGNYGQSWRAIDADGDPLWNQAQDPADPGTEAGDFHWTPGPNDIPFVGGEWREEPLSEIYRLKPGESWQRIIADGDGGVSVEAVVNANGKVVGYFNPLDGKFHQVEPLPVANPVTPEFTPTPTLKPSPTALPGPTPWIELGLPCDPKWSVQEGQCVVIVYPSSDVLWTPWDDTVNGDVVGVATARQLIDGTHPTDSVYGPWSLTTFYPATATPEPTIEPSPTPLPIAGATLGELPCDNTAAGRCAATMCFINTGTDRWGNTYDRLGEEYVFTDMDDSREYIQMLIELQIAHLGPCP